MKTLKRRNQSNFHSIEAYACSCNGACSTICECRCSLFGDKSATWNDTKSVGVAIDRAKEAKSANYRK